MAPMPQMLNQARYGSALGFSLGLVAKPSSKSINRGLITAPAANICGSLLLRNMPVFSTSDAPERAVGRSPETHGTIFLSQRCHRTCRQSLPTNRKRLVPAPCRPRALCASPFRSWLTVTRPELRMLSASPAAALDERILHFRNRPASRRTNKRA